MKLPFQNKIFAKKGEPFFLFPDEQNSRVGFKSEFVTINYKKIRSIIFMEMTAAIIALGD